MQILNTIFQRSEMYTGIALFSNQLTA